MIHNSKVVIKYHTFICQFTAIITDMICVWFQWGVNVIYKNAIEIEQTRFIFTLLRRKVEKKCMNLAVAWMLHFVWKKNWVNAFLEGVFWRLCLFLQTFLKLIVYLAKFWFIVLTKTFTINNWLISHQNHEISVSFSFIAQYF